uniref:SUN domain-containing protein n=1 Tax=Quercus lobata TaxID=97700 RepID=A0A7N2RFC4_QUELO
MEPVKMVPSIAPNNPNAAVRWGRTKVGATQPEQVQSRWVTIARILAKNLVLFVVLAGLAQLVYRLALKPNLDESENGNAFVGTHMEFEGRIAEMEAFLKKTAKMMQVQVEVVDRKIDNEIGGLKKEFAEKIEERSGILKELEAKSENLEKSVLELKSKSVEWLSKEEFEKIYEDLKTARSKEYGGDGEGSLNESVAYDRSSAPKDCRVSGWLQGHNMDVAVETELMFLLTEFTYDLEKSNAQTFNVLDSAGSGIVDTVRLDFTSNHGSPSHTCIYRFRVHGREPDSVSTMAM